jgi:hypothetical protein
MREDSKETRKTGNGQSAKTNGEAGTSPLSNSKEKGCGEIIRGIERIAEAINSQSITTAMQFINRYGLPAEKGPGSVWQMDVEKFQAWAASLGWTKSMHESELRNRIHKKNLEAAGPGNEIKGSISYLEKRLSRNMTTLFDLMRAHEGCPIKKLPDGQYRVFENEWDLFLMDIQPARRSKWETEQC